MCRKERKAKSRKVCNEHLWSSDGHSLAPPGVEMMKENMFRALGRKVLGSLGCDTRIWVPAGREQQEPSSGFLTPLTGTRAVTAELSFSCCGISGSGAPCLCPCQLCPLF